MLKRILIVAGGMAAGAFVFGCAFGKLVAVVFFK